MKVLLVSLFHPELVRGGAQQICYELFQGLGERDDLDVTLLASIDSSLPSLFKSGARITGFDGRPGEFLFLSREYDHLWNKIGDPLLIRAYVEFLELISPDVVHFHHFLTLGIDLLTATRRALPRARIVFTFHEFLAICSADGHMVRLTDRSLCTHASPVRCHQCFPHRPPEHFFVREMWMKRHLESVDAFTVPSRFMIDFFTRWGMPPERIRHVANGQRNYNRDLVGPPRLDGGCASPLRNRFGFFGQFVDNKGLYVLLRAVDVLRARGFTNFVVEINGDNLRYASEAVRTEVESFLAREATLPFENRNVILNGSYHVEQLADRMARVDWCIMPSLWWEAFGLVISEAWMFHRPVIASNIGAMKERIRDGVDGLHFNVGDATALAQVMLRAATEKGLWDRLVKNIPTPPMRSAMIEQFVALYRELPDGGLPARDPGPHDLSAAA